MREGLTPRTAPPAPSTVLRCHMSRGRDVRESSGSRGEQRPTQPGCRHGVGTGNRQGGSRRRSPGAEPCRVGMDWGRVENGEGRNRTGKAQERETRLLQMLIGGQGCLWGGWEAMWWERLARGDHAEPSDSWQRVGIHARRPGFPASRQQTPVDLCQGSRNPQTHLQIPVGTHRKDDSQMGVGGLYAEKGSFQRTGNPHGQPVSDEMLIFTRNEVCG